MALQSLRLRVTPLTTTPRMVLLRVLPLVTQRITIQVEELQRVQLQRGLPPLVQATVLLNLQRRVTQLTIIRVVVLAVAQLRVTQLATILAVELIGVLQLLGLPLSAQAVVHLEVLQLLGLRLSEQATVLQKQQQQVGLPPLVRVTVLQKQQQLRGLRIGRPLGGQREALLSLQPQVGLRLLVVRHEPLQAVRIMRTITTIGSPSEQ